MQRALDALIVHAYEKMKEFFHKVFNTTVENVSSPRTFSSGQFLCRLIRCERECRIFTPERELRARDAFSSP